MRIKRNIVHRIIYGLIQKSFRILLFAVFGIVVWMNIISPSTRNKADKLIRQGQEIYHEKVSMDTDLYYDIRQDSSFTYIYLKSKTKKQ